MAESNLFDDLQECIDAMHHAVQQCAAEECAVGDMWTVLDEQCHRLASLSAGELPDDDEDDEESEDVDAPSELNFDGDEDEKLDDEDGDEVLQ